MYKEIVIAKNYYKLCQIQNIIYLCKCILTKVDEYIYKDNIRVYSISIGMLQYLWGGGNYLVISNI